MSDDCSPTRVASERGPVDDGQGAQFAYLLLQRTDLTVQSRVGAGGLFLKSERNPRNAVAKAFALRTASSFEGPATFSDEHVVAQRRRRVPCPTTLKG